MPEAEEFGGKVRRKAASTYRWAATHTCAQFMVPWARVGEAKKETNDPKKQEELWAWLEEQVKDL